MTRQPLFHPNDPVSKLPMVGIQSSKRLENLGIYTIKDFIQHYPFRFSDSREIISIDKLVINSEGTIIGTVEEIKNIRTRRGKFITVGKISDDSGKIDVIWFNQPYLTRTIKKGEQYIFKGKINRKYGKINFSNPEYELYQDDTTHLGRISPVYPETYGISSKWLRARMKQIKSFIPSLVKDYLPENIIHEEKIIDLQDAIKKIHFPESAKDINLAKERLGLDELINIQLKAQKIIKKRKNEISPKIISSLKSPLISKLHKSLDFSLTKSQLNAIKELFKDLSSIHPMERLLNGDVGSGKTIVALTAAVSVFENGYTTIIMAPTTILADQHYHNIKEILKKSNITIPVKILTSNKKEDISDKPQIIISTHAILYKNKIPQNTAFAVVDEEHRFGVEQRRKVTHELKGIHRLTMTATPIPRTLTMAIYGEKNLSILDELPKGRLPIKTYVIPENKRDKSYEWIKNQLTKGQQLFVIFPLVDISENIEAKAAKEEYEKIQQQFSGFNVGLVHGKMKDKEKNSVIKKFHDGKTNILVATPVVEVGIDIPNATIMIIENAERFGLAQLHQFRGRIGRNNIQSYCFLFYSSKNESSIERIEYFSKNSSGFKVADYDLKTRGPGEVYGIKQHGLLHFRFADIPNPKLVKRAHDIALKLVEDEQSEK